MFILSVYRPNIYGWLEILGPFLLSREPRPAWAQVQARRLTVNLGLSLSSWEKPAGHRLHKLRKREMCGDNSDHLGVTWLCRFREGELRNKEIWLNNLPSNDWLKYIKPCKGMGNLRRWISGYAHRHDPPDSRGEKTQLLCPHCVSTSHSLSPRGTHASAAIFTSCFQISVSDSSPRFTPDEHIYLS